MPSSYSSSSSSCASKNSPPLSVLNLLSAQSSSLRRVFDLLWRKISTLRRGEKRSILNKLWDGEISKRFVLMNALMMNSLYLAKIFWRTSSKRFGTTIPLLLTRLFSGEKKEEQKNVNEHKRQNEKNRSSPPQFFYRISHPRS